MRRTRLIGLSLIVVSVFLGSMAVVPAAMGSTRAPRAVHGGPDPLRRNRQHLAGEPCARPGVALTRARFRSV